MKNLIGVSGGIKCGKDLIGQILIYINNSHESTFEGFEEFENSVNYDIKYEIKKFADKLKDVVTILLNCSRSDLESQEFKNKELGEDWWCWKENITGKIIKFYSGDEINDYVLVKLTPRDLLQLIGTECGRMIIHPNIWVNSLFSDYHKQKKWIITDTRYPLNEGNVIRNRDGLLIGVRRKFALRFPDYAYLIQPNMDEYKIPPLLEMTNKKLYQTLTHESETAMGDLSWCDVVIDNNGTKEDLFNEVLKLKMLST